MESQVNLGLPSDRSPQGNPRDDLRGRLTRPGEPERHSHLGEAALGMEYFVTQAGQPYRIGIPVNLCAEVITLTPDQVCPLPEPHPAVMGVLNWRGQLLWTVALDRWLAVAGVPETSLTPMAPQRTKADRTRTALILEQRQGGRRLACVVWHLEALLAVDPRQTQPLSPLLLAQIASGLDAGFPVLARLLPHGVPDYQLLLLQGDSLFNPDRWP